MRYKLATILIVLVCFAAMLFGIIVTKESNEKQGGEKTTEVTVVESTVATDPINIEETTTPTETEALPTENTAPIETEAETGSETEEVFVPSIEPTTPTPTVPTESQPDLEPETTPPSVDETISFFDPYEVAPNGMTNREMLACVLYQEAGWSKSCDECKKRVVDVVLNRVESPYFPNTIYEVLMQKGQYGTYYWTGIQWSDNAEMDPAGVDRAFRVVDAVLCGANSDIYGQDYVWQAEFVQGSTGFWCCGTYYGAM